MSNPDNQSTHSKKSHHENLHAHFQVQGPQSQDDDLNSHDSKILLDFVGANNVNVRLGFLQIKHVYEVRFSVQDDLGEDLLFNPLENLHAKVESAKPSEDGKGHDLVMTFSAHREKILTESITLRSAQNESKTLQLTLHARVLGKGKGTPSLKRGIHVLRIECDDESDASDWQGF